MSSASMSSVLLITDQGAYFNNNLMDAMAHFFAFNHILSTPYHPKTNGDTIIQTSTEVSQQLE
jgi:hypothetical protein